MCTSKSTLNLHVAVSDLVFLPFAHPVEEQVLLKAGFIIHSSAFGDLVSAASVSCEVSCLRCCVESLLVLSVVSFFFHLLFDTVVVLSEGGEESWIMTATLKLLSYVKEKGFLEQNPITGGEDNVRKYGALLR